MKDEKNIPKVRFRGFSDAWELRKFKNLIEELNGGASISPKDYQSEGIRTIPKGAINDSGIANLSDTKFVSENFFRKNKTSHVSTFELVTSLRDLVPSAPNLGRIVRIEGQDELFLMPQGVYKLTLFPNTDENFLISYSNSDIYRKIISQEKNGSTQVHIRNGEFLNINIFVPKFEEQQKIGAFFKQLDNTIALHQRKLEALKEMKKGFLRQLFPQSGKKVPRVRFADFHDEWELRKLGDLAEIVRGASPRPIQDPKWFDTNSDIGWLRIADVTEQNGRIYYLDQKISKVAQEKTRVLTEPHLLLSIAATVGKPVVNYVKTGVHDGFLIFLNPLFDREFMFQWFEMYKSQWKRYGQPGSQVNLNSELIKNHIIIMSSLKEQVTISNYFKQSDDIIALHQNKLNKLKTLKKAYLQNLFI